MKKVIATFAVLALSAGFAAAQQIGVVDITRACQNYWKYQADNKKLTDEAASFQEYAKSLDGQAREIQKEMQTVSQDMDNAALSPEKRDAAKKTYDEDGAKLQQMQATYEAQRQRLQGRNQEIQTDAFNAVVPVLRKVAQAKNVDVVLAPSACLYAKIDLTDDVIEQLNSTQPKETSVPVTAPAAAPAAAPAPAAK